VVLAGAEVLVLVPCIEVVQSRCRGGASAEVVQVQRWCRDANVLRSRTVCGSTNKYHTVVHIQRFELITH